jgi:hypothetical protein
MLCDGVVKEIFQRQSDKKLFEMPLGCSSRSNKQYWTGEGKELKLCNYCFSEYHKKGV